jgi:hypothetical protein
MRRHPVSTAHLAYLGSLTEYRCPGQAMTLGPEPRDTPIAIVGGGIGGLAAAAFLNRPPPGPGPRPADE